MDGVSRYSWFFTRRASPGSTRDECIRVADRPGGLHLQVTRKHLAGLAEQTRSQGDADIALIRRVAAGSDSHCDWREAIEFRLRLLVLLAGQEVLDRHRTLRRDAHG